MNHEEKACWLALLSAGDIDRTVAKQALYRLAVVERRLLSEFAGQSAPALAEALPELDLREAEKWAAAFRGVPAAADKMSLWQAQGIDLISRADPAYPENLSERLPERWLPYLLFCRGDLELLSRPSVYVAGAENPGARALQLVRALAEALAPLPVACTGGYTQGVDRQMLTEAAALGGHSIVMLPVGFEHAGPILRAGQSAVEQGTRLELSPYLPDTPYTPALGHARTRLTTVLSDVLALVSPSTSASAWPGLGEHITHGSQVLWWASPADEPGDWQDRGALAFGTATEAAQMIAGHLGLGTDDAVPPDASPDAVPGLYPETAVHFDSAASAIDRLAKTGRVPEQLMRRLRDAERQGNLGGDGEP
ncbi:MAG: DNA-processing protein DprA [Anaerolineae bacterium]